MLVRPATTGIEIWTPAKLNLFFEVLAKRSDGYHEISTLMAPVDLYDTLAVEEEPSGQLLLDCRWIRPRDAAHAQRMGGLPNAADNLAMKAAVLLRGRCRVERGLRMRLAKRIPSAAGMGGASSDAAAVLVAANRIWQLGLSRNELAAIGAELGSDVPFFVHRGAAVCRGRGEIIERVDAGGPWHAVVVQPPVGLSTPEVYRRCRPAAQPCDVEETRMRFARGDLSGASRRTTNRLEEAASELTPWIDRLKDELQRLGAPFVRMTGSGSCCYAVCRHRRSALRLAATMRGRGWSSVYVVRSIVERNTSE